MWPGFSPPGFVIMLCAESRIHKMASVDMWASRWVRLCFHFPHALMVSLLKKDDQKIYVLIHLYIWPLSLWRAGIPVILWGGVSSLFFSIWQHTGVQDSVTARKHLFQILTQSTYFPPFFLYQFSLEIFKYFIFLLCAPPVKSFLCVLSFWSFPYQATVQQNFAVPWTVFSRKRMLSHSWSSDL